MTVSLLIAMRGRKVRVTVLWKCLPGHNTLPKGVISLRPQCVCFSVAS